jgi:hypothetical protein
MRHISWPCDTWQTAKFTTRFPIITEQLTNYYEYFKILAGTRKPFRGHQCWRCLNYSSLSLTLYYRPTVPPWQHLHPSCRKRAQWLHFCLTTLWRGQIIQSRVTGLLVNNKLERMWKEAVVTKKRHYPCFCLEGLGETTKLLSEDSRSWGRDLNPRLTEHEARQMSLDYLFLFSKSRCFVCSYMGA